MFSEATFGELGMLEGPGCAGCVAVEWEEAANMLTSAPLLVAAVLHLPRADSVQCG